jgi:F-type H+-transporting ATPase subunit b
MTLPLGFAENSIQLVPDGTLLLHILIILVMIFVLNATLYKPINRILEAREKRTKGRLSEAEEIIKSVNEKLSEYERQLRQARGEAYSFAESQRSAALKERQEKLSQLRQQMSESTAKEKEDIHRQAEGARATLETESRRIARDIGARLLGRSLTGTNLN